jgi:hypothetical protein
MASKKGRAVKITDEILAEVLKAYEAGGIPEVMKLRGCVDSYARTLIKRAQANAGPVKRTGKKPPKPATAMALSKAIGGYLDEVAGGYLNGSGKVNLGALAGFPGTTTDPKVVRAAVEVLQGKAEETVGAIAALKLRQRIRDLRLAAEALDARAEGSYYREIFVAYGAEWAETQGIDYETFRDAGVSAEALRAAGITRG